MFQAWFLPSAILAGLFMTFTALNRHADPARLRSRGGLWLLLGIGWFPFLIWLLTRFAP